MINSGANPFRSLCGLCLLTQMLVTVAVASPPSKVQYAPGQLIVRYKEESSTEAFDESIGNRSFSRDSRFASLADLHNRHRLGRMRRVIEELRDPALAIHSRADFRIYLERSRRHGRTAAQSNSVNAAPDLHNIHQLDFDDASADMEALAAEYRRDPNVEYAYPNYRWELAATPNDPQFSQQYAHTKMSSALGWNRTTGSAATVIAVIDSGVDWNHPDLATNIWSNTDEIAGNGIDDDANGFIDDTRGWDFIDVTTPAGFSPGEDIGPPDNNPMDFYGHGTVVAGAAAAVTNNSTGVAGTCWSCKIMPLKVAIQIDTTDPDVNPVYILDSWVANAIYYAARNGASVINLSIGGLSWPTSSKDAIDFAYDQNIVIVGAAGNNGEGLPIYPAAYPKVISVAATDENDARAVWGIPQPPFYYKSESEFGPWVDVAAPGSNIVTTAFDNTYASVNGTSIATPHVAGLAALIRSLRPALSNAQIMTIIGSTTDRVTSDKYIGTGRINIDRALQMTATPTARITSPPFDQTVASSTDIVGTADSATFASYTLQYGVGLYPTTWTTIQTSTTKVLSGVLGTWNTTGLAENTKYTIRLSVKDTANNTSVSEIVLYLQRFVQAGWPRTFDGWITQEGLASGDLDNDGKSELALIVGRDNGAMINISDLYLVKPDGTNAAGWPQLGLNRGLTAPTVVDITGDGRPEVIVQGWTYGGGAANPDKFTFHVFNGNGTYLAGWPIQIVGTEFFTCQTPSVGDIDGDGTKEIVFACDNHSSISGPLHAGKIFVYRANGTAFPGWPKTIPLGYPDFRSAGDGAITHATLADLNADGKAEIIVGAAHYLAPSVHAYKFDGTELTGWPKQTGTGDNAARVVAGDIDNNGDMEVVATTGYGSAYVWNGDGSAYAGWPKVISTSYVQPVLADLDGDRDLEIIIQAGYTSALHAYHHNGVAVSGWPVTNSSIGDDGADVVADITGDTIPEIIQPSGAIGLVNAWQANGVVASGWPRTLPSPSIKIAPLLGDFDNDGQLEIAIGYSHSVTIWRLGTPYVPGKIQWKQFWFDDAHSGAFKLPATGNLPVAPTNLRVIQ